MVKSIAKALKVLKLFSVEKDVWSAQEIEEELNIHKSSVQRYLTTLEEEDFLQRVDENRSVYKLGMAVFVLGKVAEGLDLRSIAFPIMEELTELTRETTHLCVIDEKECLYIAKIDSPNSIRMVTKIGKRLPLHTTAVGKVLLSGMPEEYIQEIITEKGLEPSTPNSIVTPEKLFSEIEKIRKQGYAVDNEERELGLKCLGAPIKNREGKVIAAISVSGPTMRIKADQMKEYADYVMVAGAKISEKLGYLHERSE